MTTYNLRATRADLERRISAIEPEDAMTLAYSHLFEASRKVTHPQRRRVTLVETIAQVIQDDFQGEAIVFLADGREMDVEADPAAIHALAGAIADKLVKNGLIR